MRLRSALVYTHALALGIVGCSGESERSSAHLPNMDDAPGLVLREIQRIGSVADPDLGFSRVGGLDVDDEGNLYVFERVDLELRVYSPEGELVRRIAGPGEGPGELGSVLVYFGVRGDTVWIFDRSRRRLHLFDREGTLLSSSLFDRVSVPLHAPGSSSLMSPRWMDADGLFVGGQSLMTPSSDPGGPDTVDIPRIRFSADGEIVDTADSYPLARFTGTIETASVGRSTYRMPVPPATTPLRVLHADGRLRIDRSLADSLAAIRIVRFSPRGDSLSSRLLGYRPQGFPAAVLDAEARDAAHVEGSMSVLTPDGIDRWERLAEDSSAARAEIRARMDWPEFQSPVRSTELTTTGELWLLREDEGGATERWTILDANDLPRGELEVPRDLPIRLIRGDTIWTVETDELEIPWVVRYQVEEAVSR